MAVTDHARNRLFSTLRATLGDEDAATMMELLPPAGWGDVARQRDVDLHFEAVDRRFDAVEYRFESLERQLGQTNRFIGWMIATNAGLIAVVTLVVTLVSALR